MSRLGYFANLTAGRLLLRNSRPIQHAAMGVILVYLVAVVTMLVLHGH